MRKAQSANQRQSRRMISVAMRLRRLIGLTGLLALLAGLAIPANAGLVGTGTSSYCDSASMVFLPWGDNSNYMLTPGGSFEESTTIWKLSGGAKVISGNDPYFIHSKRDSRSLYMPAGSSATTPTMCFAPGAWHLRFMGVSPNSSSAIRVTVMVN